MFSFYPTCARRRCVSLLLASIFCFSVTTVSAQVKDSTVTAIYTSFKSYWTSGTTANNTVQPDTSHNLLAFTFRGKIYATGVNNAILNTKLGSGNYSPQVYKALPVKNIAGTVPSGTSTYIATAIKNDGDSTRLNYTSPYPIIKIADVLTDGKNGLDLGTGVTNLPKGAHMSFSIKSLSTKASTDSIPDLVFTQIADPSANAADTIFFFDSTGALVGNKKLVYWNTVSKLGTYKLDLYTLSTVSCNTSSINGGFQANGTRDIRMVAFLLTEFGITNATLAAKVRGIQISPNGTSDQAFIAYNTSIITIDVPVVNTQPQNQVLCTTASTSATFGVSATSTTAMTYQWKKNGAAIQGATAATYTASGLTLADTANAYTVTISNATGSVTTDPAYVSYVIVSHPSNLYLATGSNASFAVQASGATAFQWQKNGTNISNAIAPVISRNTITLSDSGAYRAIVTYAGGTCTSNAATLKVENPLVITAQPQSQVLCNSAVTTASFAVAVSSSSAVSYQWYKNAAVIAGATASTYTPASLTLADTANSYTVTVTNGVGSVSSSPAGVKYLIVSQPAPSAAYLATGNTITFSAAASSAATAFQWRKNGVNISGAQSLSYKIDTVTTQSAGNYSLAISYTGGSCISNVSALTTAVVLYSKPTGSLNDAATWGVQVNGMGSTPINFDRSEHTFVVANRDTATSTADIKIAGTFDVADGTTTIGAGTTFEAGRIIRSLSKGAFAGTPTSSLLAHGKSDLYFDTAHNMLRLLTINTTDTVTLHTPLHITAGKGHGLVTVVSGVFVTGDSLTLKSDSLGTAGVGKSAGEILGKVTVERFIPARRSWRLFASPVAATDAPTINAAWQEGAVNSADNPHPGYGTHITNGLLADGFDQNPQKTFSMKVRSDSATWIGVPATNRTRVTDYPAFFLFIRGNRSYDIKSTKSTVTPLTTNLRTTGYLKVGTQPDIPVSNGGFTLVGNPYASPIDLAAIMQYSSNVANRIRIWNPNLGGTSGTGAFVLVYWNGTKYSTIPNIDNGENLRYIQANEGFFVEGTGDGAFISFRESDKDTVNSLTPFGRFTEQDAESKLEVNLRVFNSNSTISLADGVAYLFGNNFNNNVDEDDFIKMTNTNENLGILSDGKLLMAEQRKLAQSTDSLHLNWSNIKTATYELEMIPANINSRLYLFDKYLNTLTPLSATDTSRITVSVLASVAASKAADRFTIVSKPLALLPVSFTGITAVVKDGAVRVSWHTANETNIHSYEVERSANSGSHFEKIGEVAAASSNSYSFTDSQPAGGINYYRVKSIGLSGEVSYTSVANVVFGSTGSSSMTVYPNPVRGSYFSLALNHMTAGKYVLTLLNSTGAAVHTQPLTLSQPNSVVNIVLSTAIARGTYELQLKGEGKQETIKLVSIH